MRTRRDIRNSGENRSTIPTTSSRTMHSNRSSTQSTSGQRLRNAGNRSDATTSERRRDATRSLNQRGTTRSVNRGDATSTSMRLSSRRVEAPITDEEGTSDDDFICDAADENDDMSCDSDLMDTTATVSEQDSSSEGESSVSDDSDASETSDVIDLSDCSEEDDDETTEDITLNSQDESFELSGPPGSTLEHLGRLLNVAPRYQDAIIRILEEHSDPPVSLEHIGSSNPPRARLPSFLLNRDNEIFSQDLDPEEYEPVDVDFPVPSPHCLNESIIKSAEHGDCPICFDDVSVDPVGCIYCRKFVGCRQCIQRWFLSGKAKEAANTNYNCENHYSCPLCRHDWGEFPEVESIFLLEFQ